MAEDFREPQSANEALLQNILGAQNETREPQSVTEYYLQKILEQGGGGGGGLPEVTEDDNGKTLAVVDGAWGKGGLSVPAGSEQNQQLLWTTSGRWYTGNLSNFVITISSSTTNNRYAQVKQAIRSGCVICLSMYAGNVCVSEYAYTNQSRFLRLYFNYIFVPDDKNYITITKYEICYDTSNDNDYGTVTKHTATINATIT